MEKKEFVFNGATLSGFPMLSLNLLLTVVGIAAIACGAFADCGDALTGVLIGGGVSAQQKLLIDPIAAKVRASVMPAFAEGLEIRAAQLHNDAGMVGAIYYFRQSHPER